MHEPSYIEDFLESRFNIKADEDEGVSDSQNPWARLFSGSSVEVKEIKVSKTKRRSRSVDIASPGRPTGPLAQREVPQK